DEAHGVERSIGRVFRQGIVVNALNPKTAVFFLAFLPQFIDPSRGAPAAQTAILGLTFIGLGMCTDSVYALAASAARRVLRRSRRFAKAQRYTAGTVFVGLGVAAAVTGSRSHA
ncbi:MAG TPA: LysE family translocator, partial [Actinomycetota bacterium]|nr:LysE family translocator [Actinomycetota bacterium]